MNAHNAEKEDIKEVDLKFLLNFIYRNYLPISLGSSLVFILSIIISLFIPKTWEGEFQIVLSNEKQNKLFSSNKLISSFKNSLLDNDIKTQIKILESPSVLMPIFNFVKEEKLKKGYDTNSWRFKKWSEDHLNIQLEKGTKILNISYIDKDQNIILPALKRISETYQRYTDKQSKLNASKAISYLNKEIETYEEKNKISQRNLVTHSLKYDLEIPEILERRINPRSEIERSELVSEIKSIKSQINTIKDLENEMEILKFTSLLSNELKDEGIKERVSEIENSLKVLDQKSLIYKEKFFNNDRNFLNKNIIQLKQELIDSLNAKASILNDKLSAINSPQEILIKQRELALKARLELETIEKLQSDRRALALKESENLSPWELITNPTLSDNPIKPSKKRFSITGGSIGLIVFSIICFLKERISGFIYEEEIISKKIKAKLLYKFKNTTPNLNELFFKSVLKNPEEKNRSTALIKVGDLEKNQLKIFESYLKKQNEIISILDNGNYINIDNYDQLIIVSSIGKVKEKQLSEIMRAIELSNKKLLGWINI